AARNRTSTAVAEHGAIGRSAIWCSASDQRHVRPHFSTLAAIVTAGSFRGVRELQTAASGAANERGLTPSQQQQESLRAQRKEVLSLAGRLIAADAADAADVDLVLGEGGCSDGRALMRLITALQERKHSLCLPVFRWALATPEVRQQVDLRHCNKVLHVLAQNRQVDDAFGLFHEMRGQGLVPDIVTYNTLIHACAMCGRSDQASATLRQIRGAGLEPDVISYNILMDAFVKSGQPDQTLRVFKRMRAWTRLKGNITTFNILVNAYAKGGALEQAVSVLQRMRQRGISPNMKTYTSLLDACAKAKDPEKAMELYGHWRAQGVKLDGYAYTALVDACASGGQPAAAMEVCRHAREQGIEPHIFSRTLLNQILTAFTQAREPERAREVLELMRAAGTRPERSSYTALVKSFSKIGEPGKGLEVLESMQAAKLDPEVSAFCALINSYVQDAQPGRAMQVFGLMRDAGHRGNFKTCTALMEGCAKVGRAVDVTRVLEFLRSAGMKADTGSQNILMRAYVNSGQLEAAAGVFQRLSEADLHPDITSFNILIDSYAKASMLDQAVELFSRLEGTDNLSPNTNSYSSLMDAYMRVGQPRIALEIFDRMRTVNAGIDATVHSLALDAHWTRAEYSAALWMAQRDLRRHYAGVLQSKHDQETVWALDLRSQTSGSAQCLVLIWLGCLTDLHPHTYDAVGDLTIITGSGQPSQVLGIESVRKGVTKLLHELGAPFAMPTATAGCLVASPQQVAQWIAALKTKFEVPDCSLEQGIVSILQSRASDDRISKRCPANEYMEQSIEAVGDAIPQL
ncbi:hypothetical protein CYMTET_35299, partial [Cymbomonas tetramitiformis]